MNVFSGSAGTYNTWNWQQAPPVPGYNYPGAVVHPMTSNVPGQAPSGPAASQPYAAPLHCPTATDQVPSTSTATPYSPVSGIFNFSFCSTT